MDLLQQLGQRNNITHISGGKEQAMTHTPIYIAKRYLFSRKSINAINIISGISMAGVLVGSAALIIILSVFNGLEEMILKMYGDFAPQLRIEAKEGKSFSERALDTSVLEQDERVAHYTKVLQEKVLLRYGNNQFIGTLKGAEWHKGLYNTPDSLIQKGRFLTGKDTAQVVIGSMVEAYLGIPLEPQEKKMQIYAPKRDVQNAMDPASEFTIAYVQPVGVLKGQPEVDEFVFTSLQRAKQILGMQDRISAIELNLMAGTPEMAYKKTLSKTLGTNFVIKDRGEQNPLLYKILNSEKWAIFLILIFVLAIAILNIIGSLTMLVVDKKKDIAVLKSLGASPALIKNIFFTEGIFIALIGCVSGILLGFLFCVLQMEFGLITMDGNNLITDVYPVSMRVSDFTLVFFVVLAISAMAAFVSSRLSVKGQAQLS